MASARKNNVKTLNQAEEAHIMNLVKLYNFQGDYFETNKCFPSTKEITKATGLSSYFVNKYQNDFDYETYKTYYKALSANVLHQLYTLAMSGNLNAIKLFLEYTNTEITKNNDISLNINIV